MKPKSRIIAALLCITMILMLTPGAVFAAEPAIADVVMDPDNVRIRVDFSEGIYTNSDGTGGVTADDFILSFEQNGGTVSNAITSGPRTLANGDPAGGESSFFFYLALTDGPASGVETIEIRPKDGASVYNAAGEAMAAGTTTGAISLFDKRVEFAPGYPSAGSPQEEGSKQAQLVIYPLNETVTAYYVVIENEATAPSSAQVMDGKDSEDGAPLAKGTHANVNTGGIDIAVILPEDATDYDAWVVIQDAAGNTIGPVKVDLRTPDAATTDYVCEIAGGPKYATLDDALSAISGGEPVTIKLLDDINYNKGISISDGRNITFNLDGYTLNVVNDANPGIGLIVTSGHVGYIGSGAFNVIGTSCGVSANGGSATATVTNATATLEGGNGAVAINGGDIVVNGDAQGGYNGVSVANPGSTAVINGNAVGTMASDSSGARAGSGGSVTINGGTAQGVYYGAYANGSDSLVTITGGDAIGTGANSFGVHAEIGGTVHIIGNTQGTRYGVYSSDGTSVSVTGNATVTAEINGVGVDAQSGGTITIGGNVVANGSSLGALAISGGEITIDGAVMASNYIKVYDNVSEMLIYKDGSTDSQTIPTTKEGYFTYSAGTGTGASTVWVKEAAATPADVTGMTLDKTSLAQSGGKVNATVAGTNLDAMGTDLKVSLDGGASKIGTVTGNTGTEAIIEFDVPENTAETDRTDTVTLYLNGAATGHSASVTVAAIQVPVNYTVTFDSQGGSLVASIDDIASGSTISEPETPAWSGHTFGGWYKESDCIHVWNFSTDTVTGNITLYAKWTVNPPAAHTVSVWANPSMGGSVSGGGTYNEGATVTVTATPKSGYSFISWTEDSVWISSNAAYTFEMGTEDRNLKANFTAASSSHSSGGGGGSPTSAPSLTAAQILDSSGSITSTITPKLDSRTGIVSVQVGSALLNSAFNKSETDGKEIKTVVVSIPKIGGAKAYETTLPVSFLSAGDASTAIKIKTNIATVTVPGNMLNATDTAGAQNISLTITAVDKSKLAANVQTQIGNKPIIELSLMTDGKQTSWNNENAPVTVSIPYTPTAAELQDSEHIVIWYIDGSGKLVSVPNGRYDPATGTVKFTTTHFSYFAIAYMHKTFNDLGSVTWAEKSIEVLASKGILRGTSEKEYNPQSNITRADFLCFLVRTLGVDASVDGNFDDIDKNAYYYKEIAIAKKLGITTGLGNNKFNPDAGITRQDMMVMTERALKLLKKIKQQGMVSDLKKYADKSLIAPYAINSVASLVKEELIEGSGGNINPLGNTTRAEAAVFLYRIYNKYPG